MQCVLLFYQLINSACTLAMSCNYFVPGPWSYSVTKWGYSKLTRRPAEKILVEVHDKIFLFREPVKKTEVMKTSREVTFHESEI